MPGLDMDYILDEGDIGLFNDIEDNEEQQDDSLQEEDIKDQTNKKNTDTEVDTEKLFQDSPKSVGNQEDDTEVLEEDPQQKTGPSPNSDFFSSIAEAFVEEGILPNLDKEEAKKIKTPEEFRKAVSDYIQSELTEQQQRVVKALDNGVAPDVVKQYEGVLGYLSLINEDILRQENEQAEELRKRLIYQDFINRGFDPARAEKQVKKALDNGTDIEDAIDALEGNIQFYLNGYNQVLEEAKQQTELNKEMLLLKINKLKESIYDEKTKYFGELQLDKQTRKKVYENISKPVFKDPQTGNVYTALLKYLLEHGDEYITAVGVLFTLTDGFKNLDNLTSRKVKKELKRGFKDLESRINNTQRDSYGNLKYTSGVDGDLFLDKGIKLNI